MVADLTINLDTILRVVLQFELNCSRLADLHAERVHLALGFLLGGEFGVVDEAADLLVGCPDGHLAVHRAEGLELYLVFVRGVRVHHELLLRLHEAFLRQLDLETQRPVERILELNELLHLLANLCAHLDPEFPHLALGALQSDGVPEVSALWVYELDEADEWRGGDAFCDEVELQLLAGLEGDARRQLQLLDVADYAVVESLVVGIRDGDGEESGIEGVDLEVEVVFGQWFFRHPADHEHQLLVGSLVVHADSAHHLPHPFRLETKGDALSLSSLHHQFLCRHLLALLQCQPAILVLEDAGLDLPVL